MGRERRNTHVHAGLAAFSKEQRRNVSERTTQEQRRKCEPSIWFYVLLFFLLEGQEVADEIQKQEVWKNRGQAEKGRRVEGGGRKQQPTLKLGYLTPRSRAS